MAKNKKTLDDIKTSIQEADANKKEVKNLAKDINIFGKVNTDADKPLYLLIAVTVILIALGAFERNRMLLLIGGITFCMIVAKMVYTKINE